MQREGAILASDSEKLPTDQVLFIFLSSHTHRSFFNLNSMHQSSMASCIWISVRFVNASTNFIHAAQIKNHMLQLQVFLLLFFVFIKLIDFMLLLQGRKSDSPAADQVPGRQTWIGRRIRGAVYSYSSQFQSP